MYISVKVVIANDDHLGHVDYLNRLFFSAALVYIIFVSTLMFTKLSFWVRGEKCTVTELARPQGLRRSC